MSKQPPEKWQSRIVGYADVDPNELLANPANWRVHPKAQQDALSGVLSEVGWVQAVVVNKTTGHVVDGHLRVSLALSRDEATIPVVLVELTEDEEKLVLATIDPIAAMAVADKEQLDELLKGVNSDSAAVQELIAGIAEANGLDYGTPPVGDPGAAMDRAAELQAKWNTARGQIWQVGQHRVMCGDSTNAEDVGALMDGAKAALLWSDPPYNVAYSGLGQNTDGKEIANDDMPEDEFSAWLLSVGKAADKALGAGACVYLCHGDTDRHSLPFIELFGALGWTRSCTIIWAKQSASMGWQDYRSQHECVSYGWKRGDHYFKGDRDQTTVWQISRDATSGYAHPTQKPVELVARAIENSSRPNDTVYDPFIGSGTTAVASEQLNRICYGMEIEPKYVAVTLERLGGMGLTPELVKND